MLLQVLLRHVLRSVRGRDGRCFRRQAADDSVLVRVDVGLRRWVVVLMHPSPFRSLAAVEDLRLEGGELRVGAASGTAQGALCGACALLVPVEPFAPRSIP